MPGVVGHAGERGAQALVAGPAPADASGLAALIGDGSDAGLGGELVLAREAGAHVAELGQDLGGADCAGSGERHDDPTVGQRGDRVLDAAGELGDLGDQGLQSARERAHEFALGFAFRFAGAPFGGAAQAFEQGLGRAAPAVAVLGEEAGQALGPEARGRFGRRIALEEGERDRAGEIG